MEPIILDTNIFFNMEYGINLGLTTKEVIENVKKCAGIFAKKNVNLFFMPPRVRDEFMGFFEGKDDQIARELLSLITIKSPDITNLQFNAMVLYKFVEDVRLRSYKGLRVGEEELVKIAKDSMGKSINDKKEFEMFVGSSIKHFRQRYRQATREGFLDSLADLDLIVLAKELNGNIVSTDEGVIQWGRLLGVKEMSAAIFGEKVRAWNRRDHQE